MYKFFENEKVFRDYIVLVFHWAIWILNNNCKIYRSRQGGDSNLNRERNDRPTFRTGFMSWAELSGTTFIRVADARFYGLT